MHISIIVPVQDEEAYVSAMIESVRRQEHADFELIFADDGSTDSTRQIISDWAEKDSRVSLIGDGRKLGKVAATNLAFAASSGALVSVLGADDTLPGGSLGIRASAFVDAEPLADLVVAHFRLTTMSTDKRFDGLTIPRAAKGNPSGGTTVLTRALAEIVFPIDDSLVAEDIWISTAARALADRVIEDPRVVLNYRIHQGNSNPRHQRFDAMTVSLHARMLARERVLTATRLNVSPDRGAHLRDLVRAEHLRFAGKTAQLLGMPGLSLSERLYFAANSHRLLYALRSRFYKLFSGWQ